MPPVGDLVELDKIQLFMVEKIDDQGLTVSRFDEETSVAGIISERTSLFTIKAAGGLTTLPSQLQFPRPKIETAIITYQKYVDADLATSEPVTSLVARYGKVDRTNQYYTIAAAIAGLVAAGIALPKQAASLLKA